MEQNSDKELFDKGSKDLDKSDASPEIKISEDVEDILEQLPEQERKKVIMLLMRVSKSMSYKGPVPHPDIVKGYNEVIPNGGERILAMSEKQSNHRIDLEKFAITEQLKQSRNGQLLGFIIAVICLIFSFILSLTGHETVAALIGGSTIVGLVTTFVLGKRTQEKNLGNKK